MKLEMTGVLLAGGKSRRMGRDKRYLVLEGRTLLDRSLSVLEGIFQETLVVVANPLSEDQKVSARVVTDIIPGSGSLGGLFTGLTCARFPRIFLAACDMPFLKEPVIRYLASCSMMADIVMVKLVQGYQPLHAFYSKRCLSILEKKVHAHQLKIQDLIEYSGLSHHIVEEEDLKNVDPHALSFMNVNTPSDLEFSRKLLTQQRP